MNPNLFARFKIVFDAHAAEACMRLPDGTVWTFDDLQRATGRMAAALREEGVGPGDRVVVQVSKTPDAIALYLATLQVGGVYVPLNTDYTGSEVAYFLRDADPSLFVVGVGSKMGVTT
ncbi:MAG: AMP-binding protein, partial [Pseudomonadales bacterium]|nr:AMP-binding protein [Pseudomonadales bacterium]